MILTLLITYVQVNIQYINPIFFQADGEGNFMPEREGYVNDVIVEGKIITEGGILHKIGTKKHNEGEFKSF